MTDSADNSAPAPPAVDFDGIPDALRERRQWLVWKYEKPAQEGKKPRKVPYYVDGSRRVGEQGSDDDRRRLVNFARAQRHYAGGGWSGVGFAFLPGDGLFGVDLDEAIDLETGEVKPGAKKVIEGCDSWTEVSASGFGVHIYLRGRTDTHKVNAAAGREFGMEIFCERQFFAVTGRTWPGAPAYVREAGAKLLARLHAKVDELKGGAPPPAPPSGPVSEPERRQRELVDALGSVNAGNCSYDEWVSCGMILKAELGDAAGFHEWDRWSALDADRYDGTAGLAKKWASFKSPQSGDLIFKLARAAGWRPQRAAARPELTAVQGGRGSKRPPAGGDGQPPGAGDRGWVFPFLTDKFKPRGIRENVYWAFQNDDDLQGLVAFNEFSELHESTRRTPWGRGPGEWKTIDDLQLANYLAHRYHLTVGSPEVIQQAVDMAARDNPTHPLRDRLRSLTWDRTERISHWTVDLLGTEDTTYTRLAGRMFLIGMVARVLAPGCKMDYALILQGRTGKGKSSAFRALAEPYFADTVFKIGDKDALMAIQGVWLYELSELDALSKTEHTAAKAFISSQEDRFRLPYGTRVEKVPRRAVLCGTTNAQQFLSDPTGDRRYWPMTVGDINVDGLRHVRDQLFAEAVAAFDRGERFYPTAEEEAAMFVPAQDAFKLIDVWVDYLEAYVNSSEIRDTDDGGAKLPLTEVAPNCEREFFTTRELIQRCLRIDPGRIDNATQMQKRVARCMQQLGFEAGRDPTKTKRGYRRRLPPPEPPPGGAPASAPPVTPPPADTVPAQPDSALTDDERARQAMEGVDVQL